MQQAALTFVELSDELYRLVRKQLLHFGEQSVVLAVCVRGVLVPDLREGYVVVVVLPLTLSFSLPSSAEVRGPAYGRDEGMLLLLSDP